MSPAPPNILLVNGSSLESLGIQDRLTNLGFEVTSINDLSDINFKSPNECKADLLILDFSHELESESGSVEEEVKKSLNIPIVFIAQSGNGSAIDSKMRDSKSAYILKPLEDSELKATIESLTNAYRNKVTYNTHVLKTSLNSTNKESDAFNFLMRTQILDRLDINDLENLSRHAYFNSILPGQYLEFEGDDHTYCFIVKSGRIAMIKTTPEGKELTVELLGAGDCFDLVFAIEADLCELSARAQVESEVLWIRTEDLRNVLDKNKGLYKDFTCYLAKVVNSAYSLSNKIAYEPVKARIASLLNELVIKFSDTEGNNNSPISIRITRHQIADRVGTTTETATRVTREMHKQGIIDCGSPGVIRILDIEGLENFM